MFRTIFFQRADEEGKTFLIGDLINLTAFIIVPSLFGLKHKSKDQFLLELNIGNKPIDNKSCEGNTNRALKRRLKDLEPARIK